jgi:CheY-like chemotaxis protein
MLPAMRVRLLTVDDHADVRFLIRAIVEDSGLDVEVAGEADGAVTALEQLDAVQPDVVVLDALMPGRDGFELAPMILERRPGQPIVLCSALVDDVVRERAAAAGIAACLSKDDFDALPALVSELARAAAAP